MLLAVLRTALAEPLGLDVSVRDGRFPQVDALTVVHRIGGDVTVADQPVADGSPD
ncbi:hypothetical protein [uncultured Williamsia sp.]|uniref:hypothetical protein n=1 Tax=uncultured Williamsia sp. TaxID=259311 RepID=UPI0026368164|nr:hypothetical protein [uncultured Williamsia sp.]